MASILRRLSTATRSPSGPLDGIRILDLTRVLAGPYCSMILGDLGAQVIKIEEPLRGDDTRSWGPPFASNTNDPNAAKESAYFLGVNRNKLSVTVNIKDSQGQEILQNLASQCDVLIENYLPGKLSSYGLGYEQLNSENRGLIYASITGYGPDGPMAQKPGYDVIIEGEAGLMSITGERGGSPVKVGVAITDLSTGLFTHGAILAALLDRYKTGLGQKIDVSLLECQVAGLANIAHSHLIGGVKAQKWGTQHASIVPYQAFKTSDGHIVIGAGNDRQFVSLCNAIGRPDLAQEERFSNNSNRVKHREELIAILTEITSEHPTSHWLKILEPSGIPFGPVNSISETFSHPQVLHRRMVETVDHPTAGPIRLVGVPVKYSRTPGSIRLAPPTLGQHTDSVLKDLCGYSEEKIADLRARRVV